LENELKIKKFDISKLTIDKPFKISDDLLKKLVLRLGVKLNQKLIMNVLNIMLIN
jgi:hypothetical protein